jgi:hypothetical protein
MFPEDYEQLCSLLEDLASKRFLPHEQEKRHTLEIHVTTKQSKVPHIFSVDISVMKRTKSGRPTVIIGATTNITDVRKRQQQQKDMIQLVKLLKKFMFKC